MLSFLLLFPTILIQVWQPQHSWSHSDVYYFYTLFRVPSGTVMYLARVGGFLRCLSKQMSDSRVKHATLPQE
jgi:hypothetical protein